MILEKQFYLKKVNTFTLKFNLGLYLESLFFKGGNESVLFKAFLNAQACLKETTESRDEPNNDFTKLLVFLQNIYEIKSDIIDNLFCHNLSDYKCVDELLNKKFVTVNEKTVTKE